MNSYFALLILIIIGLLLGICTFHTTIPLLYHFKFGQSIRKEGPKRHNLKSGTPTLGGIVIFLVSFFLWLTLLLFNHYFNSQTIFNILQLLIPFLGFGLIGFIDDFLIIIKKNNVGLHPKTKLLLQILIAIISTLLYQLMNRNNVLNFFGESLYLSFFYLIWIVIGFVGFSNATNLTDGIDGLLGGCSTISFTGIYLIAIYEENYVVAYLSISIIIALLAFLFFNLPKAKIFMGDTGSLAVGAIMFAMLISLNKELLIIFFGFIYIVETVSVILQVWFFKKTKGSRLFRMTPLHHHFELLGYSENKIDLLFWTISVFTTIIGIILGVKIF